MFDSKHYVPILKWKGAEQGALKKLSDKTKECITPLIQFVPQQKPQDSLEDVVQRFEEQTPKIPKKILEIWGNTPIFVDISLLFTTPLKIKSLSLILTEGQRLGGSFIPVIHLHDDQEIKKTAYSSASKNSSGFCLRLVCADFSDINELNQSITEIISSSGLDEKEIDLLVDIKETDENKDKYKQYIALSQKICSLGKWRTFIFAGGSFPSDLSKCKDDEENLIPRFDWSCWKEQVTGKNLQRLPTFADYTIQYPIYRGSTQFFHPTASLKYTLENEWMIMKGKKQRFEMYLGHAKLLSEDKRFLGSDFSFGDCYIAERAKHLEAYMKNPAVKGTGNTATWLTAGINHHLTLVAHQVANLI